MTKEEIKELEERTYAIGWSGFPIDTLFNDIRDNNDPRFNKDLAYQDFKKIIDEIYILKDKAKKYDEKVTPKKPKSKLVYYNCRGENSDHYIDYRCPVCNFGGLGKDWSNYCPECMQKLDWSDKDEEI